MGGAPTPKWDPIGLTHSHVSSLEAWADTVEALREMSPLDAEGGPSECKDG